MRIQASAGPDKKKCLSAYCHKLSLTANDPLPDECESELLRRLYQELSDGQQGSLLYYLRQVQDEGMEPFFRKPKRILLKKGS